MGGGVGGFGGVSGDRVSLELNGWFVVFLKDCSTCGHSGMMGRNI